MKTLFIAMMVGMIGCVEFATDEYDDLIDDFKDDPVDETEGEADEVETVSTDTDEIDSTLDAGDEDTEIDTMFIREACHNGQTRCLDNVNWIMCENSAWSFRGICTQGTKCVSTVNNQAGCAEVE